MDTGISLKGNAIRYNLMPSLQHMSAVAIVIAIRKGADVKHEMVERTEEWEDYIHFLDETIDEFCQRIENEVLDGVSQLPIPHLLRYVSNIVHPIIGQMFDWILYQEKYIFNKDNSRHPYPDPTAVKYLDDLVWTSRGRIDFKGTAKALIAKEELSDECKYIIACVYCCEDDVAIIAPKVINILFQGPLEKNAMVYFWTSHITKDFTVFNKAIENYNRSYNSNRGLNEFLFHLLITNGTNEVAIKYVWKKLSDEEKSMQCFSGIAQSFSSDIRCFILSQLSEEQQQRVFKTIASMELLLSLLDHWLWGWYFIPTMHHISNVITEAHYIFVLDGIIGKMYENYHDVEKYNHYKATLKECWQCASKRLKEYFFDHNGSLGYSIFFRLFDKNNVDIIQTILFDSNDIQKKKIIFSKNGINQCRILIIGNDWDLLEWFIGQTLFTEDDVDHLKHAITKAEGNDIAVHFIQNEDWHAVERFENWAFKTDDEIKEFRQDLLCSTIIRDILKSKQITKEILQKEYFFKLCTSMRKKQK